MSYYGGGGGRRRNNRGYGYEYDEPALPPHEAEQLRLQKTIIALGEVDPEQEFGRVAEQICEAQNQDVSKTSESIRISVTEQPYKIPYYAALIRLLHDRTLQDDTSGVSYGRQILEDYWKGFQTYLDKLEWRNTRLCVHLFAHLTAARVVSAQTMFELLKSFTAVLEEFAVSHGRAKKAALCAAEGLMIAGATIKADTTANVMEIITSIQAYIETMSERSLVQSSVKLHSPTEDIESADEILDCALKALQTLNSADFAQTADSFPQPYLSLPPLDTPPFDLPSVLVPPEVVEIDTLSTDSGEDALVKKEEWADYYVRLFENDVTPDPTTPAGYAVRSGLLDLVDVFEVNRKECARLLLEFPKWMPHGTFRPRPGAPAQEPVAGKDWQLESTIMETVLGTLFLLPEPPHKPIYYITLITEICKLSPSTVGPAVGKSIRRLYGLLADGLDVALAHRFSDWFSIHMSNFNFQWVWKEWIPDMELSDKHPKKAFMRTVIGYEIRLAYYDRIMKTLPEMMANPDNGLVPSEGPGPDFDFDDPARPHHEAAQSVLNLLRGRAKAEDVMTHLESLKNSLDTTENVDSVVRSIAVQSLLHIGSRSFSHFLNAIERYLPLLRNLSSGGISSLGTSNQEARMDILTAVADFWRRGRHMIVIVFDKLMQYQIVDPTDVVAWAFTMGVERIAGATHPSINALQWEAIKSALDKANGRVVITRRRVSTLRKEADEKAAMAIVSNGTAMEVDAEAKPAVESVPESESPALTTALKAFAILTREQKAALSRTLDGFVDCLASATKPNPIAKSVISENIWHNRANWNETEWVTWVTWGWYRHFCRVYSPYLRNYATTLGTVSFAKVGNAGDPAVDAFRRTWNIATGQDA